MQTPLRRAAAALSLALGAQLAHAIDYTYTTLAPQDAVWSDAYGVNNLGQVSGDFSLDGISTRGFIYSNGSYTVINGPAGAVSTDVEGISDSGIVVGSFYNSLTTDPDGNPVFGPGHGFILANGNYTTIDLPTFTNVFARGISPDGRYVSGFANRGPDVSDTRSFVLDRSTGNVVVLGQGGFTISQGINASYVLAGSENFEADTTPDGIAHRVGFLYDITSGTRTDYEFAAYDRTVFRGINDAGTIAGWLTLPEPGDDGVLHNVGFVGTPDAYQLITRPGAADTMLGGINNSGWLGGTFYDANGNAFGFLATPVPEPETWALMLAGLAVVGFVQRRRMPGARGVAR